MSDPKTFIPTLDLLNAIQTAIAALESSPGVAVFEKVAFYSEPDLVKAIEELRLVKSSLCLIVPDADRYEMTKAGREMRTEVLREVVVLMADRHFGNPQAGATGDATHLGVVAKKDILEDKLTGLNLGFQPRLIRLHPVSGQSFQIALDKGGGRKAWQMTFEVSGGWKIVQEF